MKNRLIFSSSYSDCVLEISFAMGSFVGARTCGVWNKNPAMVSIMPTTVNSSTTLNRPEGSRLFVGLAAEYRYLWRDPGSSVVPPSGSEVQNRPVDVFRYLARR